jgi:5-methylcytosine-specific restriction protein A
MEALQRSTRKREYKDYDACLRGQVAFAFLQDAKLGHRKIDEVYLGKDSSYTKGFQSMGILHYQGLVGKHHGTCAGLDIDSVIAEVSILPDSSDLVGDLVAYKTTVSIEQTRYEQSFQKSVEESLKDAGGERRRRLRTYNGKPEKIQTISYAFNRSPDVVAEALLRAKGFCERCKKQAPFLRKSDGSPYLEVHHKIPLSEDGEDSLENVLALCPNCHREVHFG